MQCQNVKDVKEKFSRYANLSGLISVPSLNSLCNDLNLVLPQSTLEALASYDFISFETFYHSVKDFLAEKDEIKPFDKKYGRRSRSEWQTMSDVKKRRKQTPETGVEAKNKDEEMLVAAWAAVACEKGTLTRAELVQVFINVGLECGSEEAAASVFETLCLKESDGLTLESLLTFIRTGSVSNRELKETPDEFDSVQAKVEENCPEKSYLDSLRLLVEQQKAEIEKLKSDLFEANQRAQFLAQDVDEHHTKWEASTLQKIRTLETRHAEKVRELTEQLKTDHEQMSSLVSKLEIRIRELELEEGVLKIDLNRAREEYGALQDEHQALLASCHNLVEERNVMIEEIANMDALKIKVGELEAVLRDQDVVHLSEKIRLLESENVKLKDQNDELNELLNSKPNNSAINHERNKMETSLNEDILGAKLITKDCLVINEKTNEEILKSLNDFEARNKKLEERCEELERSLEQLQDVYEKTEDYWSAKLDEERILFENEQKQSDEKYSDLVNKILEYEEMMKEENSQKKRLETIDECEHLERQVLEIEESYEKVMLEKDRELDELKSKLFSQFEKSDDATQTEDTKLNYGVQYDYKYTTMPCKRSLTFTSGDRRRHQRTQSKLAAEISSLQCVKEKLYQEVAELAAERDMVYKEIINRRTREVFCGNNVYNRIFNAERRCKALESTLNQERLYTTEFIKKTCNQHKKEIEELKKVLDITEEKLQYQTGVIQEQFAKLSASDGYAKDLFVENSHLVAALRHMENQINQ